MSKILSTEQLKQWNEDGFLLLKGFYSLEDEILPIQKEIYRLFTLMGERIGEKIQTETFSPEKFDDGLPYLVKANRAEASVAYDAVKKLPSYVHLASCEKHTVVAKELLESDFVGFAPRGYGIRLDHASEDKFLTQLHQDYTSQLGSPKGVVFWSPLRKVTKELGPVVLYPGSHKLGVLPIEKRGEGSYGLWLENEDQLRKKFDSVALEVDVGDVVIMDYLLLHESSPNRTTSTRWSMISRYFDFTNEVGRGYGWKGGLAEGNSFEAIHPELTTWKK